MPTSARSPTKNPAARSEAERAEIGERQMRPCTPTQYAPAPRESAIKPVPHPAAPVGRSSQTRRNSLTSSPRMIRELWASAPKVASDIFSFPPAAAHFLFDVSKRKWGADPCGEAALPRRSRRIAPAIIMAASHGRQIAAPTFPEGGTSRMDNAPGWSRNPPISHTFRKLVI